MSSSLSVLVTPMGLLEERVGNAFSLSLSVHAVAVSVGRIDVAFDPTFLELVQGDSNVPLGAGTYQALFAWRFCPIRETPLVDGVRQSCWIRITVLAGGHIRPTSVPVVILE